MVPGFIPGRVPRIMCRSVPQMALAVRRTMASVGSLIFGSFTSSRRTSPTPWNTIAFMKPPLGKSAGETVETARMARNPDLRAGTAEVRGDGRSTGYPGPSAGRASTTLAMKSEIGLRDARRAARPGCRRAAQARLRAAAPARHGRIRQLRPQLLDHLRPDRRHHPLRVRTQDGRAPGDDPGMAARLAADGPGGRLTCTARLELSDRGRALSLGIDPGRARRRVLHRLAQLHRPVR